MKKSNLLLFFAVLLAIASCKKDEAEPTLIDPTDANALTSVLIIPDADRQNGAPPAPSTNSSAPEVVGLQGSSIISSNGSTVPLNFEYSNISNNLGGCYVQINGAGSYFNVPYTANSGVSGSLELPVGIPTNIDGGEFTLSFCVYDGSNQVSNIQEVLVNVLRLGTGALQVSLSWNTATDQDLHVEDPSGYEIYYVDDLSPSGGELDRDDVDGYGPENIFWLSDAPDGVYKVWVEDYEITSTPNTVYLTINGGGKSKSFTMTTQNGSQTTPIEIKKSGDNYDF